MKKIVSIFILFLCCINWASAQTDSLIWTIKATKQANKTYTLQATTNIPKGFYLYGSNPTIDGLQNVNFVIDTSIAAFINQPAFSKNASIVTDKIFDNKKANVYFNEVTVSQDVVFKNQIPSQIDGSILAFIAKEDAFVPCNFNFDISIAGGIVANNSAIKIASIKVDAPIKNCGEKVATNKSLFTIFLLGIAGGLVALFTPCVFPMIPVTVSFFTKRSPNRKKAISNGFLYGFFIFIIYLLFSAPFHLLGLQPEVFNVISTNPWVNIGFFAIFIFFAISFFGYFDLSLPHSIAGKADSKSNLGSIGGIFFMAVTLVIVSFSCTGVILGTLLVGTASNGAWALTAGMAGFGVALGLPFALFAIFPHWLQSLPKSGGWLDTVKKVLAFVELALALKFLSNADLVSHWGFIKRETFIAIWMLICLALAVFLLGKLKLPHTNTDNKIGLPRKIFAFATLAFAGYLSLGITNTSYANLQLISGFPPPLSYSIYSANEKSNSNHVTPNFINDYNKALALAKQQNKKVLIDFTGWACVNCRKMEEQVWTKPEVAAYIKQHYILVSLYVDDKQILPLANKINNYKTTDGLQKDINTVGDLWATFQTENFNKASQPLYVVLDTNEQLISNPIGYTSAQKYLAWLQCGN
jgi:thiol:disulfide interchange protein